MKTRKEIGSFTAKGGFVNERTICEKFNNWKNDTEAKIWLNIMGYKIDQIIKLSAIQVPLRIKKSDLEKWGVKETELYDFLHFKKADAQIKILIKIGNLWKIENISLKKANKSANFNQIDKRSVDSYKEMWGFDSEIAKWLKLFTGEIEPDNKKSLLKNNVLRDKKRVYLDEMPQRIQERIINFFKKNVILVTSDVLKGRGGLSANWMLVTRYDEEKDVTSWILKDINTVMNHFGKGDVKLSPKGSLKIGKITMQRKGGTPDPTKLQFKIKPCDLFELNK